MQNQHFMKKLVSKTKLILIMLGIQPIIRALLISFDLSEIGTKVEPLMSNLGAENFLSISFLYFFMFWTNNSRLKRDRYTKQNAFGSDQLQFLHTLFFMFSHQFIAIRI